MVSVLALLVQVCLEIRQFEHLRLLGSFRLAARAEAEAAALGNAIVVGHNVLEVQVDHEPDGGLKSQAHPCNLGVNLEK
jgi:hypothetical protein